MNTQDLTDTLNRLDPTRSTCTRSFALGWFLRAGDSPEAAMTHADAFAEEDYRERAETIGIGIDDTKPAVFTQEEAHALLDRLAEAVTKTKNFRGVADAAMSTAAFALINADAEQLGMAAEWGERTGDVNETFTDRLVRVRLGTIHAGLIFYREKTRAEHPFCDCMMCVLAQNAHAQDDDTKAAAAKVEPILPAAPENLLDALRGILSRKMAETESPTQH